MDDLLLVMQTIDQKQLMEKYGQEMCLLYAVTQPTWTILSANLALIRGKQYSSNSATNIVNYNNYHHHQESYCH